VFIIKIFKVIYLRCLCFCTEEDTEIYTTARLLSTLTNIAETMDKLLAAITCDPTASCRNLFTNTSISTDNYKFDIPLPLNCMDDIPLLDDTLREHPPARAELVILLLYYNRIMYFLVCISKEIKNILNEFSLN